MQRKLLYGVLIFIMLSSAMLVGLGASHIIDISADEVMSKNIDITLLDDNCSGDEIIPISKHDANYVYLGGKPLGIDVKSNGLIITSKQEVVTNRGTIMPCKDVDIKAGDVLKSIDGISVTSQEDIARIIKDKEVVTLLIERNNALFKVDVRPQIDVVTNTEKLGLWLKDGIQGIGTLTYIDANTRRYGALGHPIEEGKTYRKGAIYDANIYGYIRGQKGKAGELSGSIENNKLGTIEKNTTYGIFGTYMGDVSDMNKIEVASRDEVRPGKAYIYTTIDGCSPKRYEIEVIKKNTQNKAQNKGMVIRIIDRELLSKTNGILQGMSGSPIIQNNKLIGAVTHVFINDPTKGFGMYIDWMLPN